jgi:hypothetical protein
LAASGFGLLGLVALGNGYQISGFIRSAVGARVVIELRDGRRITADLSEAIRRHSAV